MMPGEAKSSRFALASECSCFDLSVESFLVMEGLAQRPGCSLMKVTFLLLGLH